MKLSHNRKFIYLDYNATTPVAPEVVKAMAPYWREVYGNPSSSHQQGRLSRRAIEQARTEVATLVGVSPEWIIFTGGATEANNLALMGVARRQPANKRHLIVSNIEHPAVLEPAKALQREGWAVSLAPVDEHGSIKLDVFESLLRPDTSLVSIMHANNEIGTIQPIPDIARLTRARGIVLHTDAAQSAGKIRVDVSELGVNMLTLAGHKFYAPKGVGALVRGPQMTLDPIAFGAGHEFGIRPGTENVPLIVGLGEAARLARARLGQRSRHMQSLRDLLHQLLQEQIPHLRLNGHLLHRLPNTLNVSLPDCNAHKLLAELADSLGASAGSACHSDSDAVSGVLGAMGIAAERALGAIRLSVGIDTTKQEIRSAAQQLVLAWENAARR